VRCVERDGAGCVVVDVEDDAGRGGGGQLREVDGPQEDLAGCRPRRSGENLQGLSHSPSITDQRAVTSGEQPQGAAGASRRAGRGRRKNGDPFCRCCIPTAGSRPDFGLTERALHS